VAREPKTGVTRLTIRLYHDIPEHRMILDRLQGMSEAAQADWVRMHLFRSVIDVERRSQITTAGHRSRRGKAGRSEVEAVRASVSGESRLPGGVEVPAATVTRSPKRRPFDPIPGLGSAGTTGNSE